MSGPYRTRLTMKFTCKVTPTIMDGLVVRWKLDGWGDGEISASRKGVLISGNWPIMGADGVELLKKMLDRAHGCFRVIEQADREGDRKGTVERWLREVAHEEIVESAFP